MTNDKGRPPAPLHPRVARKLLDLLSSDDEFRDAFAQDAGAALARIGYEPATGEASAAQCLQLQAGKQLASKERFARVRQQLEDELMIPMTFLSSSSFGE